MMPTLTLKPSEEQTKKGSLVAAHTTTKQGKLKETANGQGSATIEKHKKNKIKFSISKILFFFFTL